MEIIRDTASLYGLFNKINSAQNYKLISITQSKEEDHQHVVVGQFWVLNEKTQRESRPHYFEVRSDQDEMPWYDPEKFRQILFDQLFEASLDPLC